eukprot:jgi/Astpho2/8482/fgenesh1_pg.00125_%23_5_t
MLLLQGNATRTGYSCRRECRNVILKGESVVVRDGRKMRFFYHADCFSDQPVSNPSGAHCLGCFNSYPLKTPTPAPPIRWSKGWTSIVQRAQGLFDEGVSLIRSNDIPGAVEQLGRALQLRTEVWGETALECASSFYKYGAALFWKAQDESDILGNQVQAAAARKDAAAQSQAAQQSGEEEDSEEDEEEEEETDGDEKENIDEKGKAPLKVIPTDQGSEDEDGAADADDAQLAWEMMEMARRIWEIDGTEKHLQELAGKLSWEAAYHAWEITGAAKHLRELAGWLKLPSMAKAVLKRQTPLGGSQHDIPAGLLAKRAQERQKAELHFKLAMALQFAEKPEQALKEIKVAIRILEGRIDRVRQQQEAPAEGAAPGDRLGAGAPPLQTPEQEVKDMEEVLEDLHDKVDELEEEVKTNASTRASLRATFAQVTSQITASQGQADSSSSLGPGPSSSADVAPAAPQVVDLGVVGRGKRRVTPVAVGGAASAAPVSAGTAAGPSQPPPAGSKRSFANLMGGEQPPAGFPAAAPLSGTSQNANGPAAKRTMADLMGGEAAFLSVPSSSTAAGASKAPAIPAPQVAEPTLAADSNAKPVEAALPAFLQPAAIAKVYGSASNSRDCV